MQELFKKNFGFGCMRLPMVDEEVDVAEMTKMVDTFIENGFDYFDTAHGYLGGKSEKALKECLTSRYPRESYILVNKLSTYHFEKEEEIRPLFDNLLECCGVEYFDLFLLHAQDKEIFKKYKKCRAYEHAFEFKREGRVKHVGLSFHDKAEVLDEILTTYPEIEVVQIQLNYIDMLDSAVDSKRVHEVCLKHNKPIIVMEPVKGGSLVNMPENAKKELLSLGGGSVASYAIRYAASQENVKMVLSGMGSMEMMNDNISYMKDFKPIEPHEQEAIDRVCEILKAEDIIPCTACRYCTETCPQNIKIPEIFACMNGKNTHKNWNSSYYYDIHTQNAKASDCIQCGACEAICPQHLEIRELLKKAAADFENE